MAVFPPEGCARGLAITADLPNREQVLSAVLVDISYGLNMLMQMSDMRMYPEEKPE